MCSSIRTTDTYFSIGALSGEECYRQYHFMKSDILRLANIVVWNGSTERNTYKFLTIAATCIILRRLSYPSRWQDLEEQLGMH